jgi:hypothetical protein
MQCNMHAMFCLADVREANAEQAQPGDCMTAVSSSLVSSSLCCCSNDVLWPFYC